MTGRRIDLSFFTWLEEEEVQFVRTARTLRMPATGSVVSMKAEMLRPRRNISPEHFKVSLGWLQNNFLCTGTKPSVILYGKQEG